MSVAQLNYSTHAAEQLAALAADLEVQAPLCAQLFRFLRGCLLEAPVFVLPEAGAVLGPVQEVPYTQFIGMGRPPFPATVIEFEVPRDALPISVNAPHFSPKRLAVMLDLSDAKMIALHRRKGLPDVAGELARLADSGRPAVLVWPIDFWSAATLREQNCGDRDTWMPPSFGIMVLTDEEAAKKASRPQPELPSKSQFEAELVPAGELGLLELDRHPTGENLIQRFADSASLEVAASVGLMAALSCKNIQVHRQAVDPKLNKARISRGRQPFRDFHVLTVDPFEPRGSAEPGAPTGRRVAEHLRRGHIRHYPTHNTWINHVIVNAGRNLPRAEKSYRVRAGAVR